MNFAVVSGGESCASVKFPIIGNNLLGNGVRGGTFACRQLVVCISYVGNSCGIRAYSTVNDTNVSRLKLKSINEGDTSRTYGRIGCGSGHCAVGVQGNGYAVPCYYVGDIQGSALIGTVVNVTCSAVCPTETQLALLDAPRCGKSACRQSVVGVRIGRNCGYACRIAVFCIVDCGKVVRNLVKFLVIGTTIKGVDICNGITASVVYVIGDIRVEQLADYNGFVIFNCRTSDGSIASR